jgi:hypothetical protein
MRGDSALGCWLRATAMAGISTEASGWVGTNEGETVTA